MPTKIFVCVSNISVAEKLQVKACLKAFNIDKFKWIISPYFKLSNMIESNSIAIGFGEITKRGLLELLQNSTKITNVYSVFLPKPSLLANKTENLTHRQEAFVSLKNLKELLDSGGLESSENIEIDQEDIPTFEDIHDIFLKQANNTESKTYRSSKNNRLIEISVEKNRAKSKADIFLAFDELYTAALAMRTLQLKKIEIVKK